jgi:hypothetical protein
MKENSFVWPHFNYVPTKLIRAREKLELKWGSEEIPKAEISTWAWERLLKEIEKLPSDQNSIHSYAIKLKKRYVSILSYQFMQVPIELMEKVSTILNTCMSRTVIKNAWNQFQQEPSSNYLKSIIAKGFSLDFSPFKGNIFAETTWINAFKTEDPITSTASHVTSSSSAFLETVKSIGIHPESKIQTYLLIQAWIKGNKDTFLRESPNYIVEELKRLPLPIMATIIDRYLKVLEVREFQTYVGDLILKEFGRPDGKDQKNRHTIWESISTTSQTKFLKWVFMRYIDLALDGDPERIQYWKKQVYQVDDIIIEKDLGILVMYFRDYVIVEFMANGNALYCYRKEDYTNVIRPRVQRASRKNKEIFKDQSLVKERLIHSGNWQWKADYLIREITRR